MYKSPYHQDSKDSIFTCKSHWEWAKAANMPSNSFDFISIHKKFTGGYTLCAPLCLLDEKLSTRPSWENKTFNSINKAFKAAIRLAIKHNIYCVDCTK